MNKGLNQSPDKLCPPPIEDVIAKYAKGFGIPLAILQNSPENPEWENKKVWILKAFVYF